MELLIVEMSGDITLGMLPEWIGAAQAFLASTGQMNHTLASVMAWFNLDETLFLEQFQVARQCGPVH